MHREVFKLFTLGAPRRGIQTCKLVFIGPRGDFIAAFDFHYRI